MVKYSFEAIWRMRAPLELIWQAIYDYQDWPKWWKGVEKTEQITKGDANGVGGVSSYTFKSALPYRLYFNVEATGLEPMKSMEGKAVGDLDGTGRWVFSTEGDVTIVQCFWDVSTTSFWMNLLAPIARPIFAWNHKVIMNWGAEGLASKLGASLISTEEKMLKPV